MYVYIEHVYLILLHNANHLRHKHVNPTELPIPIDWTAPCAIGKRIVIIVYNTRTTYGRNEFAQLEVCF